MGLEDAAVTLLRFPRAAPHLQPIGDTGEIQRCPQTPSLFEHLSILGIAPCCFVGAWTTGPSDQPGDPKIKHHPVSWAQAAPSALDMEVMVAHNSVGGMFSAPPIIDTYGETEAQLQKQKG